MLRIPSAGKLTRFLTDENKADPEALRIIEVTALARIADSLRDLVNETTGTRY
jgi:hypothetical protein